MKVKKLWFIPICAAFMLFTGADLKAEAATTKDLSSTASKYLGVPYVYGGTSTNGFDCSGFTKRVFSDLGYSLNRTSSGQYSQGNAVSKANLQPGDLVFFKTNGYSISHVGIYLGNNKFINAETSSGVTVSSLSESYWAKYYAGAKRVVKFTNPYVAKAEVKQASIDFSVYASRGEVAIQLAKALNLDTTDTDSKFVDVKPTDKFAGAATALQKLGVFTGDENGKFNPNSPITRSQISKVLVEAFNLQLQEGKGLTFKDVSPHSTWAYNYIMILATNGVTSGKGDGTFGVNDHVTLTQLKIFIDNSIQQ